MSYKIVTDSSCNLPDEIIDHFDLTILSLVFFCEGVESVSYVKGETTNLKQFFDEMREGKIFTTSLPNMQKSEELMEEILKNGDDILYIGFSSGLSGTYEAVRLLCQDLQKRYPERKIVCVDTLAAALGEGILVYQACQMKENGAALEEVAGWLEYNKLHACHWFTVDDLMFLYRGGRVSRTSAYAGTMLKIKPVLHVDDEGKLIPQIKCRGRAKSIKVLFDKFKELHLEPINYPIAISHGDCLEDAMTLKAMIEKEYGPQHFIINYLDPVIGAHAGPGTVAFFFMGTHR